MNDKLEIRKKILFEEGRYSASTNVLHYMLCLYSVSI